MSAPQEGRNSPDPEAQSGKQQADPQANPNQQGAAPSEDHAKETSEEQLKNLPSNPEHILEKPSVEKTSKTMN